MLRPQASTHLFLKIVSVQMSVCVCVCVCVFVCPSPRLLITSGMIWCDMDSIRLVKHLSLMGVALELVRVLDSDPIRVS